jgi:hypothetical protein
MMAADAQCRTNGRNPRGTAWMMRSRGFTLREGERRVAVRNARPGCGPTSLRVRCGARTRARCT